jgi:hypothetical protein
MRVVITTISTRAQFSELTYPILSLVQHLLTYPDVAVIYLLVQRSRTVVFEELTARCDSRLEIIAADAGSGLCSCHLWHYNELPKIAARLRADLVHLSYPVLIRRNAFFPLTALSLQQRTPGSVSACGTISSFLDPWILRQCLRVMNGTAWISEPMGQQLGFCKPQGVDITAREGLAPDVRVRAITGVS